jgi:hypothetical protein
MNNLNLKFKNYNLKHMHYYSLVNLTIYKQDLYIENTTTQ